MTESVSLKEVIAYHGWGFEANCWRDWQTRFVQHGYSFQAFNRGYWHPPLTPQFTPGAAVKVILSHSYGLHLCPIDQLQQADVLVIFAGFAEFHPQQKKLRIRSQKTLQIMIEQFKLNPDPVLRTFWTKCYHPNVYSTDPALEFNAELLLHDLQELAIVSMDFSRLISIPKIVIVQGSQDRILACSQGQELAEQLALSSTALSYRLIDPAGHAIPFTHLEQCWLALPSQCHHPSPSQVEAG